MSIDAQVRICQEYAASKGYSIVKIYADEAISGKGSKTTSRYQYQRMIKDAEKDKFNVILVHKYDRIARNVGEHVNLEIRLAPHDVKLIAVAQDFGTSKEAKIMKTMMWALSEYYIDNLSEEVKKGHKIQATRALHNGGYAPFGYDVVDQTYVINSKEAHYVKRMFECALNRTGFTALIAELADKGITGKRGKSIKYTQIYEILRNEKYTGVYIYSVDEEKNRALRREKPNAIRVDSGMPAIISKQTFKEVQKIMKARQQTGKKSYLCSGLVYCGECGAKRHVSTSTRKQYVHRYYFCSARCGAAGIPIEDIHDAVREYIDKILSDKNQQALSKALKEYARGEKARTEAYNLRIQAEISDKQAQIDNYMHTLGSSALPQDMISDIGNKMVALKKEIADLKEKPEPKDFTVKQIDAWIKSLKESKGDRATVELLVERIDATKTDINVTTTLTSVLRKTGCGGQI